MQSVTVLTPRGRRHVVKLEPNKTVLWILEQVCIKYPEFSPEDYALKHHNKVVDLNNFFRFSGLPNNCTLEMAELNTKRSADGDVILCVQLEDGTRLNGNFLSSKTISEILSETCPNELADENLVVIYMRSEIYGDALKTTTLKSLGLLAGGRALFRIKHADPESLKTQAMISAPLPRKPREEESILERPKKVHKSEEIKPAGAFQLQNIAQVKKPDVVEEKMDVEQEEKEDETKADIQEQTAPLEEKPSDVEMFENVPEPVLNILDDRGTIIFSLDTIYKSSMDLPDSFFDLTEHDVRVLYRELRNQVENLENTPLMTSEYRKLEENKKILNQLATYKNCALRIQLPNRHVIQTKFSTVSKVGDVIEFVRQFLVNPDMKFYLFMTPPKTILDNETTLIESKCVPSALLHFGTDETSTELLKPEYYEKLSCNIGASRVLLKTTGDTSDEPSTSEIVQKSSNIPKNFMESKAASKPTGAVPKWFKTGK